MAIAKGGAALLATVGRRWAAASTSSKSATGVPAGVAHQTDGSRAGDGGAPAGAQSTAAKAVGASAPWCEGIYMKRLRE